MVGATSATYVNWSRFVPAWVGCDPTGGVDDQRHVDTTLVGVLLVPLERRVPALGPAPRVVGVAVGTTDVVDPVDRLVGGLEDAVEELHLVHDAERAALLGRAVVGEHDEDRVVELTHRAQAVDQPADLVVGVVEERGEGLLEAGGQLLLVLGKVVPGVDTGVAGSQLSPRRNEAQVELAPEPALPYDVPALVVAAAVLLQVGRRRLMGCVGRSERHVGEERPVGAHALAVGQHHAAAGRSCPPTGGSRPPGRRAVRSDGCRTPGRGGTGRSRLRGIRRNDRTRGRAATGRTVPPPSTAPSGRDATCPHRRLRSPRPAAPRRSSPHGC